MSSVEVKSLSVAIMERWHKITSLKAKRFFGAFAIQFNVLDLNQMLPKLGWEQTANDSFAWTVWLLESNVPPPCMQRACLVNSALMWHDPGLFTSHEWDTNPPMLLDHSRHLNSSIISHPQHRASMNASKLPLWPTSNWMWTSWFQGTHFLFQEPSSKKNPNVCSEWYMVPVGCRYHKHLHLANFIGWVL